MYRTDYFKAFKSSNHVSALKFIFPPHVFVPTSHPPQKDDRRQGDARCLYGTCVSREEETAGQQ